MKSKLPFIDPDKEFRINAAIMLLILRHLSKTKLGKNVLTLDRLQAFHFLALQPNILARVIASSGKSIYLSDVETFIIEKKIPTADVFISLKKIKSLLTVLGAENLLELKYDDKEGFTYALTDNGVTRADNLEGTYFKRIRSYTQALSALQSISIAQLNNKIRTASKKN